MKIKSNKKLHTFTIYRQDNKGKTYAKYRTLPFTKKDFENAEYWIEGDWK